MSRLHFIQRLYRDIRQFYSSTPALLTGVKAIALLCFIGYMSYAVIRPVVTGNEKKAETIRLMQQVKRQEAENRRLQQQKDYLSSPEGVNSLAHAKGLVSPGEESIHFPPQPSRSPIDSETPAKSDRQTIIGEALLLLLILLSLAAVLGIGLFAYRWHTIRTKRPVGMLTPRSELRRRRRHAPHEA
jgi:cell division protein FtsL